MPDHPRAKRGYVYELIVVRERMIGRHLARDEAVNHINHIKTENRPEILKLMTHAEHNRLHHLKGAMEGRACCHHHSVMKVDLLWSLYAVYIVT
jgi:hypothetical protein